MTKPGRGKPAHGSRAGSRSGERPESSRAEVHDNTTPWGKSHHGRRIEEVEETTADDVLWGNDQLEEIMQRLQQRAAYEYTAEETLPVLDLVEEEARELTSRQKSRQRSRERAVAGDGVGCGIRI